MSAPGPDGAEPVAPGPTVSIPVAPEASPPSQLRGVDFDRDRAALDLVKLGFGLAGIVFVVVFGLILLPRWQQGATYRIADLSLRNWSERVRLPQLDRLDALIEDVEHLAVDGKPSLADPVAARETLLVIQAITQLDPVRRRLLDQCLPAAFAPAEDPTRLHRLEGCLGVLQALRREAATLPDPESMKLLIELAKAQDAAAQADRGFILQVAQVGLINLLLPILTALLGYLFATRAKD